MLPLLDLVAPLLRRFVADKRLMSATCVIAVIGAISADVARWGLWPILGLLGLFWLLSPAHPGR